MNLCVLLSPPDHDGELDESWYLPAPEAHERDNSNRREDGSIRLKMEYYLRADW